jgi:hypothetical protein
MILVVSVNSDYFLNSVNQLIFVMVKCVVFEVRTEFLNITQTGLNSSKLPLAVGMRN